MVSLGRAPHVFRHFNVLLNIHFMFFISFDTLFSHKHLLSLSHVVQVQVHHFIALRRKKKEGEGKE